MSYEADPEIGKWFNNADFRRALSLGIDRDQINETFWLGIGTPARWCRPSNSTTPGPSTGPCGPRSTSKKANELLDKIGLDKKDGEGFRLRTDNGQRLRIDLIDAGRPFVQFTRISEMIREHWKKIGIDLTSRRSSASLANKRPDETSTRCTPGTTTAPSTCSRSRPTSSPSTATSSSGRALGDLVPVQRHPGKEPPPRMKELMENIAKAFGVPEAERIQLGKDVWKIAAEEVYIIGMIGLAGITGRPDHQEQLRERRRTGCTTAQTARRRGSPRPETFSSSRSAAYGSEAP